MKARSLAPCSALAVVLLALGHARALDVPSVAEGLWSVRIENRYFPSDRRTVDTATLCRSHAYDQYVLRTEREALKACTIISERLALGTLTRETRCGIEGHQVHTTFIESLRPDSVHAEVQTTYSPALGDITGVKMRLDSHYIGACPAGMQPGDRTTADGTVEHLWKH